MKRQLRYNFHPLKIILKLGLNLVHLQSVTMIQLGKQTTTT
jgi:hypothetical protein